MSRLLSFLTKAFEHSVVVVMGALVVDVVWQVFTRYVLGHQSAWTEELATMLLIWGSLLGACVAFARNAHLGLDFFVQKLDLASQKTVSLYVYLVVLLFGGILAYGGYQLTTRILATNQISPALGIRMGYVYVALPLSGAYLTLFALARCMTSCQEFRSGRAS